MDLIDGHVAALIHLLSEQDCFTQLNFGTGVGYSVLQEMKMFEKVIGNYISHSLHERREGDVALCVADTSLALRILN